MTKISEGVMLSRLPRLLGVYPVISTNPQLREFANTWRSYGSVKQLQVYIVTYINILTIIHFLTTMEVWVVTLITTVVFTRM